MVSKAITNHIVGRVCDVKESDTKIEAAQKAIEVMKLAGFSKRDIAKAERMLEAAKARGVR